MLKHYTLHTKKHIKVYKSSRNIQKYRKIFKKIGKYLKKFENYEESKASIKFSYPEIPIEPLFALFGVLPTGESRYSQNAPNFSNGKSPLAFESSVIGFLDDSLGESEPKQVETSSKTTENMFFACLLTKNAGNTNEKGCKQSVMAGIKN